MIKVTCKECGKKLEAPDEAAGGHGRCPHCREVFEIPDKHKESAAGVILQKDAKCPYCHKQLPKIPNRKAKCPHCEQTFFLRTRPSDREKVIVTAEQASAIEEAWADYHQEQKAVELEKAEKALPEGSPEYEKAHYLAKAALARGEHDKAWSYFNKAKTEAAETSELGVIHRVNVGMAEQLKMEGKYKQSLSKYCEVIFQDIKTAAKGAFLSSNRVLDVRTLVGKSGIQQEEFKQVALKSSDNIFLMLKDIKKKVKPADVVFFFLEIAFGKTEPGRIQIPDAFIEEVGPDEVEALIVLGKEYFNKGEYKNAIRAFTEALIWIPEDMITRFDRGVSFSSNGEYDKALRDFNIVIGDNSEDIDCYLARGIAYAKKGETDKAMADFGKGLELDPHGENSRAVKKVINEVKAGKAEGLAIKFK